MHLNGFLIILKLYCFHMLGTNLRSQKSEQKSQGVGDSRGKQGSKLYLSKFKEALPQDRMRKSDLKKYKSKSKESGIKLATNDIVTVRQEKAVLNSAANNAPINGFESSQFQNKEFKKFTIHAVITQKNLIKESNYFDESRLGEDNASQVVSVAKPSELNFNMGKFQQFQMFQVKTYLFDRNLKSKITA